MQGNIDETKRDTSLELTSDENKVHVKEENHTRTLPLEEFNVSSGPPTTSGNDLSEGLNENTTHNQYNTTRVKDDVYTEELLKRSLDALMKRHGINISVGGNGRRKLKLEVPIMESNEFSNESEDYNQKPSTRGNRFGGTNKLSLPKKEENLNEYSRKFISTENPKESQSEEIYSVGESRKRSMEDTKKSGAQSGRVTNNEEMSTLENEMSSTLSNEEGYKDQQTSKITDTKHINQKVSSLPKGPSSVAKKQKHYKSFITRDDSPKTFNKRIKYQPGEKSSSFDATDFPSIENTRSSYTIEITDSVENMSSKENVNDSNMIAQDEETDLVEFSRANEESTGEKSFYAENVLHSHPIHVSKQTKVARRTISGENYMNNDFI